MARSSFRAPPPQHQPKSFHESKQFQDAAHRRDHRPLVERSGHILGRAHRQLRTQSVTPRRVVSQTLSDSGTKCVRHASRFPKTVLSVSETLLRMLWDRSPSTHRQRCHTHNRDLFGWLRRIRDSRYQRSAGEPEAAGCECPSCCLVPLGATPGTNETALSGTAPRISRRQPAGRATTGEAPVQSEASRLAGFDRPVATHIKTPPLFRSDPSVI